MQLNLSNTLVFCDPARTRTRSMGLSPTCAAGRATPFGRHAGRLLTGPLREGPGSLTGPSQRRTTKRLTGRQGRYWKPLTGRNGPHGSPYGKGHGKAGPLRGGTVLTRRAGLLREGPGSLTGPSQIRTTKRLTGRQGSYGKPLMGRNGPYGKGGSLREGPGSVTGLGPFTEKNDLKLQESLREAAGRNLPELGGNFRLCAVDQKRSFFPRAGPFLDLLPFEGPFPLTGALTGRPPYGKAPYGEASYGKAPYFDVPGDCQRLRRYI